MNRPARRGFAMATAISFIPIATVAMMSVGILCAADCRRTASAVAGAQLRQMLIAGAVDAQSHLHDPTPLTAWTTPLPDELAAAGATVETKSALDAGGADLTITATLGGSSCVQKMRFIRENRKWILDSVELSDKTD